MSSRVFVDTLFVVMRQENVNQALTFDHHLEQAGMDYLKRLLTNFALDIGKILLHVLAARSAISSPAKPPPAH